MSRYKNHVEQAIGETLMLRDGRRAYGQRMLDRGVPIEYVSHCMGHDSVETTQKFYADYRDKMVLGKVRNILKNAASNRTFIGKLWVHPPWCLGPTQWTRTVKTANNRPKETARWSENTECHMPIDAKLSGPARI